MAGPFNWGNGNILLGRRTGTANDYLEQVCQSLFDEFDSDETNSFVAISDVADVNPKRTIKKGEEALCVEMSDLSTSGSFPSGWRMKPYNGGMKFVNGDTIMARITPCLENGKTGYINFLANNQTAFGSTEYIVMATKGILPPEYFYFLARNREFVAYAVAHMNGSSGRQRVSGADIERYEVRMPNAEQLERFKRVAESAMKMILANSLENRRLAELRDSLLPRLMSGEIDVSQIELPTQPVNNHLHFGCNYITPGLPSNSIVGRCKSRDGKRQAAWVVGSPLFLAELISKSWHCLAFGLCCTVYQCEHHAHDSREAVPWLLAVHVHRHVWPPSLRSAARSICCMCAQILLQIEATALEGFPER